MPDRKNPLDAVEKNGIQSLRPFLVDGDSLRIDKDGRTVKSEMRAFLTKQEWKELDYICERTYLAHSPITQMIREHCYTEEDANRLGVGISVTHKDFVLKRDEVYGTPLAKCETTSSEAAARWVGQAVEQHLLCLLVNPWATVNPLRARPDLDSWQPSVTVKEILDAKESLHCLKYYGPYLLLHSKAWDRYLDSDYSVESQWTEQTVRGCIQEIDGIVRAVPFDYLSDFDILLVQMTPDVIRIVVEQEFIVVQTGEANVERKCSFEAMTVTASRAKADLNGKTGVYHITTADSPD
jgi:hypothetical protein